MYTSIVIEDEVRPRAVLLDKIRSYTPLIEVVDACGDAESGLESILTHHPDLIFLDIHLRGNNGFWLLAELKKRDLHPYVIFITAFSTPAYMQEAIRLSAIDYIFKPVNPSDLVSAVERFIQKYEMKHAYFPAESTEPEKYVLFRISGKNYMKTSIPEICCCEADGVCSIIHLYNGEQKTLGESLKQIEAKLPEDFIRIDRRYIVNLPYVRKVNLLQKNCYIETRNGGIFITPSENGLILLKKKLDEGVLR